MNNSNHSKLSSALFSSFTLPLLQNHFLPLLHKYRKVHKSNIHKTLFLSHYYRSKYSLCTCIEFPQLPCHSSPFICFSNIRFIVIYFISFLGKTGGAALPLRSAYPHILHIDRIYSPFWSDIIRAGRPSRG